MEKLRWFFGRRNAIKILAGWYLAFIVIFFLLAFANVLSVGSIVTSWIIENSVERIDFAYWTGTEASVAREAGTTEGAGTAPAINKSEVLRNLFLVIIGVPALYLAIRRTRSSVKQTSLSERGLNNERFQNAAKMLAEDQLILRQAGISSLKELVKQEPRTYFYIVEDLLRSFILRRRAEIAALRSGNGRNNLNKLTIEDRKQTSDIKTAFTCLGDIRHYIEERLHDKVKFEAVRVDLSECEVPNGHFTGFKLQSSDFSESVLNGADLSKGTFTESNFSGVKLKNSRLDGADFTKANFKNANLTKANFYLGKFVSGIIFLFGTSFIIAAFVLNVLELIPEWGVLALCIAIFIILRFVVEQANPIGNYFAAKSLRHREIKLKGLRIYKNAKWLTPRCIFAKAQLDSARMRKSSFRRGDFRGATLCGAKLVKANLWRAYFQRADLSGAELQGATLTGAKFSGAIMSKAKIEKKWESRFSPEQWREVIVVDKNGNPIDFTETSDNLPSADTPNEDSDTTDREREDA